MLSLKKLVHDLMVAKGGLAIHPGFTLEHLVEVTPGRISVRVPTAELYTLQILNNDDPVVDYAQTIASVSWLMTQNEPRPEVLMTSSRTYNGKIPQFGELITFECYSTEVFGIIRIHYRASVNRDGCDRKLLSGFATLGFTGSSLFPVAAPPSAQNDGQHPAGVTSADSPASTVFPSLSPSHDNVSVEKSASQASTVYPSLYSSNDTVSIERSLSESQLGCSSHLHLPTSQPFVYAVLTHKLKNMGITPTNVRHRPMFFHKTPNFIFFFDVESAEEKERLQKKIFAEEKWTQVFNFSSLEKNSPFFAKAMSAAEIFLTMLVATRIENDGETGASESRMQLADDREEIRKAMQTENFYEIESILNADGKRMLDLYRRDLFE
ncbi:hypothetical protein B9Z55_018639 [Caenorhabditis nigoni]|nr:hypothetical protein B9Z55_018639 [Caenorhabditis nigoni]